MIAPRPRFLSPGVTIGLAPPSPEILGHPLIVPIIAPILRYLGPRFRTPIGRIANTTKHKWVNQNER